LSISAFTIEELVSRLSSEQLDHIIDWVERQVRYETGAAEIELSQVIDSYMEEMVKREGIKLSAYSKKEPIAETEEEIAVETIWRILNPPPEEKEKPYIEPIGGILDIIWPKRKKPLKIEVIEVEPLPPENLEVLKELVKKAALRKLKEMEEERKKKKKARA